MPKQRNKGSSNKKAPRRSQRHNGFFDMEIFVVGCMMHAGMTLLWDREEAAWAHEEAFRQHKERVGVTPGQKQKMLVKK